MSLLDRGSSRLGRQRHHDRRLLWQEANYVIYCGCQIVEQYSHRQHVLRPRLSLNALPTSLFYRTVTKKK